MTSRLRNRLAVLEQILGPPRRVFYWFDNGAMLEREPGYDGPNQEARIAAFMAENGVGPGDDLRVFRFRYPDDPDPDLS
jgi:hypothetical protein